MKGLTIEKADFVKWLIGIVFVSGTVYAQTRGIPDRVRHVEQRVAVVETKVEDIKEVLIDIRDELRMRRESRRGR